MRHTYESAKAFIIRELQDPNAEQIVESYLNPPDQIAPGTQNQLGIEGLFERMLISAQNANMKPAVIGGAIGGIERLGLALFQYDPQVVTQLYGGNPDALLDHIIEVLNPTGQILRTPKSIWPLYCKTILSAASFFEQFEDGKDFYSWATHLYRDPKSAPALPMIIAAEVDGIGYPLACDFLKDLGFVNYGKPDTHILEILSGIGLCLPKSRPYVIQKTLTKIAVASHVSAYAVDKVFWLIGSGKFYNHKHLGRNGLIGRKKAKFIAEFNGT